MDSDQYLLFSNTISLFTLWLVYRYLPVLQDKVSSVRKKDNFNAEYISSLKLKSNSALYIVSRLIVFGNFSCKLEYLHTRDQAFPSPIGGYSDHFAEGARELFKTSLPRFNYKSEEGGETHYEEDVLPSLGKRCDMFGEIEIRYDDGGFEIFLFDDTLRESFLHADPAFLDYLMDRFSLGDITEDCKSRKESSS